MFLIPPCWALMIDALHCDPMMSFSLPSSLWWAQDEAPLALHSQRDQPVSAIPYHCVSCRTSRRRVESRGDKGLVHRFKARTGASDWLCTCIGQTNDGKPMLVVSRLSGSRLLRDCGWCCLSGGNSLPLECVLGISDW